MMYTVGEMAKLLGVPASTLRYYDKEGMLPFVERSPGGILKKAGSLRFKGRFPANFSKPFWGHFGGKVSKFLGFCPKK